MNFKSQVSFEFFMLVGMAFLVTLVFSALSLKDLNNFRNQKENEDIKDLALKLQQEVIIAAGVEDGYVRSFNIPDKLDSINYSLYIYNSSLLLVQSKNGFYLVQIPRIVGNISKGTNIINKTNGIIYVNSKEVLYFTSYTVCQNAESLGLCGGIDILYGPGYRNLCCCERSLCCTSPCT